jgi:hypothetical protein
MGWYLTMATFALNVDFVRSMVFQAEERVGLRGPRVGERNPDSASNRAHSPQFRTSVWSDESRHVTHIKLGHNSVGVDDGSPVLATRYIGGK